MKQLFAIAFYFFLLCYVASAQSPNITAAKAEALGSDIVGEVNGDKITRSNLTDECLQLHGEKELIELIGKTLIRLECDRQKIVITPEEINAEVLRMAKIGNMTTEEWLQLIESQRGITPEQYQQDIIWRILALAKLAGSRITISEEEIKAIYDSLYGPAVQARQIVLKTKADAESILEELKKHPDTFASVVKSRSEDPISQPNGGMLYPIRRGSLSNPGIESILFALKPGEISPILEHVPGYFTIYRCEGHLRPLDVDMDDVKEQLANQLRDAKIREVSGDLFTELQNKTQVQMVFGNPVLSQQYPGVAAILNGQTISIKNLADFCVQQHGKEVLSDMINRMMVVQACRRQNMNITDQDIDNEIREMAFRHLPLLPNGSANVELWIKRNTEESGLSIPMYRKNSVLPIVSLKRLTQSQVQVTEEDIRRSYEANFGQKVRCLAIFFGSHQQRLAQEVWHKANSNKTEHYFSDLVEQYSYDPLSRHGKGVIPPIARHCGNPELENEVFSLKPGELSQIVQVEDQLAILYCLGYTEPSPATIEDVRVDIIADIYEKKQQAIMGMYFENLLEQSVWDNFLTGESHRPHTEKADLNGGVMQ